jgi:hypothetical protein
MLPPIRASTTSSSGPAARSSNVSSFTIGIYTLFAVHRPVTQLWINVD